MIKVVAGVQRIIKDMPNFKQMREFVEFVNDFNIKDDRMEGTLVNLADPNYRDLKAIKEDYALHEFHEKKNYDKNYNRAKVVNIYKDAKALDFLERRDKTNSTHVEGIGIIVTDKGRNFLETTKWFKWKKGKWHEIVSYYGSWSIAISLIALVVSILSAVFVYLRT